MLKSMTGFGRLTLSNSICELKIEIKTVNSKYCDVSLRIPRSFSFAEIPLRLLIQEKLIRGKADVLIEAHFQKPVQTLILNRRNFIASLNVLEQMKTLGGIVGEIKLDHLLHFQDLFDYEAVMNVEELSNFITHAVTECLDKVDTMRSDEGVNLESSITKMLEEIDVAARAVDDAKNDVFLYWVNRFKARVSDFLPASAGYDERIIHEASIFAEKADIKEELARIFSHQQQFKNIMYNEFPCGKKLDFLCQEMYREWNTIASKSVKTEIINSVVHAKSMVDSIREQIQNIV